MQAIMSLSAKLFFERPARNATFDTLAANLRSSGKTVRERIAAATDKPRNREAILHLIGIERWGQRRLQVALGEPLLQDEYDGYRPAADIDFGQLPAEFERTRQDTLALVERLARARATNEIIHHNSFGPMSVRGWIKYLTVHAAMTAKLVR
jgi:hypothetical protein